MALRRSGNIKTGFEERLRGGKGLASEWVFRMNRRSYPFCSMIAVCCARTDTGREQLASLHYVLVVAAFYFIQLPVDFIAHTDSSPLTGSVGWSRKDEAH